jgi:hypothetical protein
VCVIVASGMIWMSGLMNPHSEPMDDMEECSCSNCKGLFWVPYYESLPDMGHPAFCCFCGSEFGWMMEVDEE